MTVKTISWYSYLIINIILTINNDDVYIDVDINIFKMLYFGHVGYQTKRALSCGANAPTNHYVIASCSEI